MLQTHPVRFFSGYKLIHHRQSARPPSAHHSWCYQTCLFSCPNSGPEELGLIPSQTLLARVLGRMPQQASVSREPIKCLGIRSVWTGLQQDFWETENTVLERSVAIRVSFCHLSSNNFKMGLLIFYMCFHFYSDSFLLLYFIKRSLSVTELKFEMQHNKVNQLYICCCCCC